MIVGSRESQSQISTSFAGAEGICVGASAEAAGGGRAWRSKYWCRPGHSYPHRGDTIHQIYSSCRRDRKVGDAKVNQIAASWMEAPGNARGAMAASSLKDELHDMIQRGVGVVQGAGMGQRAGMPPRPMVGTVKR